MVKARLYGYFPLETNFLGVSGVCPYEPTSKCCIIANNLHKSGEREQLFQLSPIITTKVIRGHLRKTSECNRVMRTGLSLISCCPRKSVEWSWMLLTTVLVASSVHDSEYVCCCPLIRPSYLRDALGIPNMDNWVSRAPLGPLSPTCEYR